MTVANILIYIALIGYILFKRVQGQPVKMGRKLFILPVLLVVIGYGDLVNGSGLKPIEITLTVIGGVLSLGLGALRGRADKLSTRDGPRSCNGGPLHCSCSPATSPPNWCST